MPKLLRHLLCLAILLGLGGNGIALAAPCPLLARGHPAAMADMPACAMRVAHAHSGAKHRDGARHGCTMLAGSSATLAPKGAFAASPVARVAVAAFWPVTAVYAGRDVAPAAEPPTLLG